MGLDVVTVKMGFTAPPANVSKRDAIEWGVTKMEQLALGLHSVSRFESGGVALFLEPARLVNVSPAILFYITERCFSELPGRRVTNFSSSPT